MHLTAQIKLLLSATQADALSRTLTAFNAACDYISGVAWDLKTFRQFDLHRLCYREIRDRFALTAQSAVRAISKVADSYKLDKASKRTFRSTGAAAYDDRILSWNLGASTVSIWSLDGRLSIPFVCGDRQRTMLLSRKGETDLTMVRGKYYLTPTCVVKDALPFGVTSFLGVDLGVVQIASDSDGESYAGNELKSIRYRHRRLRTKLQKKQTRASKRRLQKLSGKEQRFARHTNHVISKEIVASAKRTGRGIAIEELTGIRERIRAGRKQRVVLHSWAFAQLGQFLTYKANLAGVPLVTVDPRNTSRQCAACGHIDKRNRPNQSTFRCLGCDHSGNADTNAARVIAGRATCKLAVNVARCVEIGLHNSAKSRCL
jgi:putative transposase